MLAVTLTASPLLVGCSVSSPKTQAFATPCVWATIPGSSCVTQLSEANKCGCDASIYSIIGSVIPKRSVDADHGSACI